MYRISYYPVWLYIQVYEGFTNQVVAGKVRNFILTAFKILYHFCKYGLIENEY